MKSVLSGLILHVAILFGCFKYGSLKYLYDIKYLNVPVDHFSFTNQETFSLRYLINDSYWVRDGPIFFYTGNEGDIESFAQNTGFMWEIAPDFQASVVFAEHRYYGASLPFGNLSFSDPKYLGYLTSTQALADFVHLITYLQSAKYDGSKVKNPVITFGGSYGGMLSAWLRMKYPNTVLGAIASSAPIWQFQGLVPCDIYNRILTSIYGIYHRNCPTTIRNSWHIIRTFTANETGKQWLSSNWKLCKTLNSTQDIEKLIGWLSEIYSNLAMVNYPYPANFLAPLPAYPVRVFCEKLANISSQPQKFLDKLGRALTVYTNYTGDSKCIDIDQTSPALGEQAWDFQACTEIIMPMCSKNNDMFENQPWNFTQYKQACYNTWKIKVDREDLPLMEYGGKDLHAFSNIVFSNGLLDPWSGGGVLHNMSKRIQAVVIPEAAHHLDLRASNYMDPRSVIAARNYHVQAINLWLRKYNEEVDQDIC